MKTQATLAGETNACGQVLYMVLELSALRWKVLLVAASGRRRERSVVARDLAGLMREMAEAKRKLGLAPEARVVSCYEAGRDGFWLHRALQAAGVENLVVDSSSIEVPRRARHKKTDRIDLGKLMALLVRFMAGERRVWSVLRVPDEEVEDVRQLSRSIERLKRERGAHRVRIKSLLAKEGLVLERIGGSDWAERVGKLRRWDGSGVPANLKRDLLAEGERLALVERQLALLKAEREALVACSPSKIAGATRALRQLGAIAEESSFVFSTESLGWRTFANRRELAGSVGITARPTRAGRPTTSRASPRPATSACARCWSRSPGAGLSISRRAP